MKKTKQKTCKVCKEKYTPFQTTQQVCGTTCAIKHSQAAKDKAFKKETKRLKEKIKSRSQWLREAQIAFNQYVRKRDEKEACISCGRHHNGQYHAGHYLTVGSTPELRFHPFNNNKQCAPCNNHLSGNIVRYRPALIEKIGIDAVEWLESYHQPQKLSIDEIREIKEHYKEQLKLIS